MKAIVFDHFGPPSVLQLQTNVPIPIRKPHDVLVRVTSTSVNPVDWKTRSKQVPAALVKLPFVPGGDVAGVVTEADADSPFPPGTRVYACTDGFQLYSGMNGCYAEYVAVPEAHLAVVPAATPLADAGALPLVCLTAWQALEAANLQPGQRILIQAGAGGVGTMAIQMAKARGLHVTTTCSARNVVLCTELGADAVIDYTTQKFDEIYKDDPFDGVIDLIGGSVETRSLAVLKRRGAFVHVLNSGWVAEKGMAWAPLYLLYYLAKGKLLGTLRAGPAYTLIIVKPSGAQLAAVAELLAAGKVRPVIEKRLPLEEAAAAHAHGEEGHTRGKFLLMVGPEQ